MYFKHPFFGLSVPCGVAEECHQDACEKRATQSSSTLEFVPLSSSGIAGLQSGRANSDG